MVTPRMGTLAPELAAAQDVTVATSPAPNPVHTPGRCVQGGSTGFPAGAALSGAGPPAPRPLPHLQVGPRPGAAECWGHPAGRGRCRAGLLPASWGRQSPRGRGLGWALGGRVGHPTTRSSDGCWGAVPGLSRTYRGVEGICYHAFQLDPDPGPFTSGSIPGAPGLLEKVLAVQTGCGGWADRCEHPQAQPPPLAEGHAGRY